MKKRYANLAYVLLATVVLIASGASWYLYDFLQASGLIEIVSGHALRFYAVVIDQNGDPIPDVKVTFSLSPTDPSSKYPIGSYVMTDAEGTFEIKDKTADQLIIKSLEKPGYVFWCWDAQNGPRNSPINRETFHLLKQAGAVKPDRVPLPNSYPNLPYYLINHQIGP